MQSIYNFLKSQNPSGYLIIGGAVAGLTSADDSPRQWAAGVMFISGLAMEIVEHRYNSKIKELEARVDTLERKKQKS